MLDILAYYHVLFIIVLTIIYNFNQWRKVVWLITFFTFWHTLSLTLAAYDIVHVPIKIVEFLIPVTICTTGIFNLLRPSSPSSRKQKTIFSFALFFGLIHGLGFARYFKIIIPKDEIEFSLFSFALGVELDQIAIVVLVLISSFFIIRILRRSKNSWEFLVGAMILSQALGMILERI